MEAIHGSAWWSSVKNGTPYHLGTGVSLRVKWKMFSMSEIPCTLYGWASRKRKRFFWKSYSWNQYIFRQFQNFIPYWDYHLLYTIFLLENIFINHTCKFVDRVCCILLLCSLTCFSSLFDDYGRVLLKELHMQYGKPLLVVIYYIVFISKATGYNVICDHRHRTSS